jgi:hypothetical protein
MKPKLFRADDLINIPMIGFLIAAAIVGALLWNVVSPQGEIIPPQGWGISALTVAMSLFIVVIFYVERYRWICQYKYTTRFGVSYYYEPGATPYLLLDVEEDTVVMQSKWITYFTDKNSNPTITIGFPDFKDTVVLFKRAGNWVEPNWWSRRVTGLAYYNMAIVGQGGKHIRDTAHKHELSHIYINHHVPEQSEEKAAHELMAKVGV